MANGTTHQLAAALVVASAYLYSEGDQQEKSAKPILGAALGAVFTNLPDMLEPAALPNHRQFFHRLAFAGVLWVVAHKVYKWETDSPFDDAIRFVLLVAAGAYLVHLLLDAGTPKSLPILGAL
jgi:inner membrane protein